MNRIAVSSSFQNDKRTPTEETIAAIATPLGEGAIAIVRLSGPDAIRIVASCFQSQSLLSEVRSHSLVYGFLLDRHGERIDECLVSVMRAPRTFTGEDVVEINCHGGLLVVELVLNRVLELGARLAEPGEFSKRAFLNGRLDLAQAEAIIDIVKAKSPRGLQLAANQLEGELSRRVAAARDKILYVLAHIQVVIDYPEEGVDEMSDDELLTTLTDVKNDLMLLLSGADAGKIYRDGIRLAIVGRPNVGKSSLLNALLRDDRAIVTNIAGTTRDTIEASALLAGMPVTLVDTAGLRQTTDPVEKIGVERSRKAIETADLLLVVVDGTEPLTREDKEVFELLRDESFQDTPAIVVINKQDLPQAVDHEAISSFFRQGNREWDVVPVSALTATGLSELEQLAAKKVLGEVSGERDALLVTRARHRQALEQALSALDSALNSVHVQMTADVISVDLQESLAALGSITGESVGEEVVARIFAEFCVGK